MQFSMFINLFNCETVFTNYGTHQEREVIWIWSCMLANEVTSIADRNTAFMFLHSAGETIFNDGTQCQGREIRSWILGACTWIDSCHVNGMCYRVASATWSDAKCQQCVIDLWLITMFLVFLLDFIKVVEYVNDYYSIYTQLFVSFKLVNFFNVASVFWWSMGGMRVKVNFQSGPSQVWWSEFWCKIINCNPHPPKKWNQTFWRSNFFVLTPLSRAILSLSVSPNGWINFPSSTCHTSENKTLHLIVTLVTGKLKLARKGFIV